LRSPRGWSEERKDDSACIDESWHFEKVELVGRTGLALGRRPRDGLRSGTVRHISTTGTKGGVSVARID